MGEQQDLSAKGDGNKLLVLLANNSYIPILEASREKYIGRKTAGWKGVQNSAVHKYV